MPPLSRFERCRWITLLDMIRYAIRDLHTLMLWVEHTIKWTYAIEVKGQTKPTDADIRTIDAQLVCLRKHFLLMEFLETLPLCDTARSRLKQANLSELRGYLISLRDVLTTNLGGRVFMYVPQKYATFAPKLIGGKLRLDLVFPESDPQYSMGSASSFFPASKNDIKAIALCMLAGASTASVFHMMRVVELGIRALGKELGVRKIEEDHQGTKRRVPIEFVTWEKMHQHLTKKADVKLNRLRRGPSKQKKQEFYNSILEDFKAFREAWRNHVMHTRATYTPDEAERILRHVESFMNSLVTGLRFVQKPMSIPTVKA